MGASESIETAKDENSKNLPTPRKKSPPPQVSTESPDLSRDINWEHYSPDSQLGSARERKQETQDDLKVNYHHYVPSFSPLATYAILNPNTEIGRLYKPFALKPELWKDYKSLKNVGTNTSSIQRRPENN